MKGLIKIFYYYSLKLYLNLGILAIQLSMSPSIFNIKNFLFSYNLLPDKLI